MSTNFILEYAGAPVRFAGDVPELVAEHLAERFSAEHEVWYAAWRAGLTPGRCRVVNLYEREQPQPKRMEDGRQRRPKSDGLNRAKPD